VQGLKKNRGAAFCFQKPGAQADSVADSRNRPGKRPRTKSKAGKRERAQGTFSASVWVLNKDD